MTHWILCAWLCIVVGFQSTKAFIHVTKSNDFRRPPSLARARKSGEDMDDQVPVFDISRRDFAGWTATGAALGASLYSSSASSKSGLGSNDREETPIPFASFRKYKSITLPNGLKCLLVKDKVVTQSSCALTIGGAGQFSDTLDGLAHLMEHISLSSTNTRRRGSRNAQDFDEWLSEYDGYSNGTWLLSTY